jgi:hypothetical protein
MRREAERDPEKVRARHARWQREHPDLVLAQHRRRKAKRLAKGLCCACGKRPYSQGKKSCDPCLEKARAASRKNKLKREARASADGLCNRCLKCPAISGKKACAGCLTKARELRERGRK